MISWLLGASIALADPFYVETEPFRDRSMAVAAADQARAAGYSGRVVRRFALGEGWGFALLVEELPDEAGARAAADTLQRALGVPVTLYRLEERQKVPVTGAETTAEAPARTAAWWLAAADSAVGGAGGGAAALARAGAVHFAFERSFEHEGKAVTVSHRYWREGAARRLDVDAPQGFGTDSTAIATAAGAWVVANGAPRTRDIGVTVGIVDGFAPEAVLTLALEAHRLLAQPAVGRFLLLEGGESGVRLGSGGDEVEPGLAWIDLDEATARPVRARYVTEAGPVEWTLADWREVAPGVVAPFAVTIERADGRTERVKVKALEVVDAAPAGTFAPPGA